jgi:hypothetical protein
MGNCIPFFGIHTCNADPAQNIVCSCTYDAYGTTATVTSGAFSDAVYTGKGLKQSGDALFTILKAPNAGLLITGRANDYSCVDVDKAVLSGLTAGTSYTVTLVGKAYVTSPTRKAQITQAGQGAPSSYNMLLEQEITGTTGDAVTFTVTGSLTGTQLTDQGLRLRVENTGDFILTSFTIADGATEAYKVTF